jgi:phosphoglucosamine mutase
MAELFGTDGVRGIANDFLTADLAMKIGRAACETLKNDNEHLLFVVGKDTRVSGDMLENALCAGIMAQGGDVIKLGVIPTPAVAVLTRYFKACAGAVISASHNPYEHNGIKFFNREGLKLPDEVEDKIESLIFGDIKYNHKIGAEKHIKDADKIYCDFILSCADCKFDDLKLVIDCSNGSTVSSAEKIFKTLSPDSVLMANSPNGVNINKNCGSTNLKALQKAVVENKADGGLAFDGDGDRIMAVDEAGEVLDGDKIMYILAKDMKRMNKLQNNCVAATVMSNLGFFKALEALGINSEKTKVGDRYVIESMLANNYMLGGEQSGHIIIKEYNSTGDGLLTAVRFLSAVKRSGKSIKQCNMEYENYPQVLINVSVSNGKKKELGSDEMIINAVKEAESKLDGNGRVLLRPSGTEALVRVMLEGKDYDEINKYANNIAEIVKNRLG